MKKTTKTTKTPAPATKLTAPAPALKSTVVPKIKKSASPTPEIVAKPTGSRVKISAKIDIGFGNALFIRGNGPGLSWDKGLSLDCITSDNWTIILQGVDKPFSFKLVLNDDTWSTGPDYSAAPGETVTLTPVF
jgi:hypothetical protein